MVNVEVYIKVNEYTDTSVALVDSFEARVLADGGVYEAGSCLLSRVESLGGYFEYTDVYKRIDLFKDEKISLTSSIQNVNDLSKVFTDYTQSFTVPASKTNNQIFNYWNESAVNDGFDQRIRYDAIIEINTIPFKKGQIQIEKANEKDNRVESFSVTFYGKVKQIKDLFKEDKLSTLNYSSLNHNYGLTEVKNRITGVTNDGVYYPLVGNKHKYEYLTGTANDITIGGTPNRSIVYSDLFPAIPVSKIFEFIENKYDINFTSNLFNTSYWNDLYLYCKNIEQTDPYSFKSRVNFNTTTQPRNINVTNDTYTIDWVINDGVTNCNSQSLGLVIFPSSTTIPYRLKVYTSSGLYAVYDNLIGNAGIQLFLYLQNQNITYTFWFEVESTASFSYTSSLEEIKYYGSLFTNWGQQINTANGSNSASTQIIQLGTLVPEMKIIDFFNGIIKLFNLTITATGEREFNLEPLEFYYAYGNYININSYVINDTVDLERTKLFKKLTFTHEKSENILNNYFRNVFNRGYDYGDLIFEDDLSNESTTYEIKSPFEDVMWERSSTGNFQTTSLIDKDLKPYKPKPILMYKNNLQNIANSIYISDGSTYNTFNNYQRFSNELFLNGDIATLNFGEEQSSWDLNAITNDSLFALWYENYISGLYDIRCRVVKLKAIMPITELSNIKLNDKIVYKDKKYIINQFTTDLTTGEVDFELISDFRTVTNSANGTDRFALKQIFNIDNTAQDLEVTILKLNSEYYDVEYAGTSYESLDNYADGTFIVPIDSNTTGDVAFKQIEITYHNPDVKQYINIIQYA
jgi:hypothetical protein